MKYKLLLILSLVFLILLYTCMLWMDNIDFIGSLLTAMVLVLSFIILLCCLIWHIVLGIKERFRDKRRSLVTVVLILVIVVAYFQPFGLLTWDRFEGKDILVAEREGSANCTTVFKLKENDRFVERTVCFGSERIVGEYQLKNDTIYFSNVELGRNDDPYFEFAVINKSFSKDSDSQMEELVRYRNRNDSTPTLLWIVKNDLR